MTARILLLDIETAPSLGYVWGKYDQDVIEFERDWFILSFAAKWLDSKDILVKSLPDYKGYRKNPMDDSHLMVDLWKLLDEADIVVAHNGDSFDIKKINARFLVHKMLPPSNYKTVDTLKQVRKHFRFDSNRLGDVCKVLGIGAKIPHVGFALWKACMQGDATAWETMRDYNAQDVALLEDIYLRLRPWSAHPDVRLFSAGGGGDHQHDCPACASSHTQRRGIAVARTRKYQRWNCQDCGTWFQGDLEKAVKK